MLNVDIRYRQGPFGLGGFAHGAFYLFIFHWTGLLLLCDERLIFKFRTGKFIEFIFSCLFN